MHTLPASWVNVDTVRLWRDRWVGLQGIDLETLSLAERLQDTPRPGVKPKFTSDQRCQMAALACEAPAQAGRPISQWTGREIADELKARGIVEQISPRHAARLLKKTFYVKSKEKFSRTAGRTLISAFAGLGRVGRGKL